MSPTLDACLRSWPWDPWLLAMCLLSAGVYFRGWLQLARRDAARWNVWRLAAFTGGLLTIYLALASPLEPLASLLLQVHMVQHLLLAMVAPPLVWLGAPLLPMLFGLPKPIRTQVAGPLFRLEPLRRWVSWLFHPTIALPLFIATNLLWHVPVNYELALRSREWHYLQHVCFFGAGLIFWQAVVRPYPSRPRWSPWLLLPYLILADVQNTLLSAWLTFSRRVLYPYYAEAPRIANISALQDQEIAGVIMWVPGSVAFLGPLFWIGLRLFITPETKHYPAPSLPRPRAAAAREASYRLPILGQTSPNPPPRPLPRQGLLARFLRWRYARMAFQIPLLLLAIALIVDGLRGPQVSPLNLAGVLPWTHWRGIVVLGLLAAGNLSCMACPFTLPRRLASGWLTRPYSWPRWLQSKWLAVALVVLFLWAYEAFALWDSPWWTAWITLGYFVTAFATEALFRGAPFCKYVCPIGQFNFVQSLVSPLEVQVRDHQLCTTCQTKDCIRGRDGIPGCELELFQPRKSGNLDCTFCLDCIQACPHSNVAILPSLPGSQLWHDPVRSGVGRLSERPDIAALVVVLVFGAFANAGGMVGPVIAGQEQLARRLGVTSTLASVTLYYFATLIVAPIVAVGAASLLTGGGMQTAQRYVYALVPLGFSMWLAHYTFHFFTSYETIVPVSQRFAADLGLQLGEPNWSCSCCGPVSGWVLRTELLFLDFGYLLSFYTAYRIAAADSPRQRWRGMLPWGVLITLLFLLGVWLVLQPMQMRGTLMGGG